MKTSTTENRDGRWHTGMPARLAAWREKLGEKAKREPKFRFYSLYSLVTHKETLAWAWSLVRRNQGAPGVDGETFGDIEQSEGGVEGFLEWLRDELTTRSYKAQAVRRSYIEKENGKMRPLGIPTIKDRVVQMAVKLILEPIFEADFNDCSYGYRPGRGAKDAVQTIAQQVKMGKSEIYDADLSSYFDTIAHDKLISAIRMRVVDGSVLGLIRQWLKATAIEPDGERKPPNGRGTPQGGVISPLLSNIYLHWFEVIADREARKSNLEIEIVRKMTDKRQCFTPVQELVERLNVQLKGWARYYAYGYPAKAYREINRYARLRMTIHLKRRSQRRYRTANGNSYYQELAELGLVYLK